MINTTIITLFVLALCFAGLWAALELGTIYGLRPFPHKHTFKISRGYHRVCVYTRKGKTCGYDSPRGIT